MSFNLTKENIDNIKQELEKVLGAEWVSDDPTILSSYGRDFSVAVGKKPNIVTLPNTTEEVQSIVKLANKYKVPVVPVSTGFNHGGLALPRWGGILIDLRRMDKIQIDTENMNVAIGPHARNTSIYLATNEYFAVDGIKLRAATPLTTGSSSLLSNHVIRGGPGIALRYGFAMDHIINMTWVLPDGTILNTGPGAFANCKDVPANYGPGPDISGIFIASDGMFGICTEMTLKLLPEYPLHKLFIFDAENREKSLISALDFVWRLSRECLVDQMYKHHHGQMATAAPVDNPTDLAEFLPEHAVSVILAGMDEEELQIKEEILLKIAEESGMYSVDLSSLPDERLTKIKNWRCIGPRVVSVMGYKGSFQWTAGNVKFEKVVELADEFDKLMEKYWKPSDPNVSLKMALSGTAIQGPYPWGRLVPLEFDFWWDQGNPEEVKRAQLMLRKVTEMFINRGATMFRKMFGFGELELPLTGTYFEILKSLKKLMDPDNLMHPDLHPVTEDYR